MITLRPELISFDDAPAWISEEAIDAVKYLSQWKLSADRYGNIPRREPDEENDPRRVATINQFHRYLTLFNSLDMRHSWETVSKRDSDSFKGQIWLAYALWESLPSMFEQQSISQAEAKKWKNQLAGHLNKAVNMGYEIPINLLTLESNYFGDRIKTSLKNINSSDDIDDISIPQICDLLKTIELAVLSTPYNPYFHRKAVHGNLASRTFFIRKMTCAFLQDTGKPYRRVVADAASVAYEGDVSQREVIRTTKELDLKNQHSVLGEFYEPHIQSGSIKGMLDFIAIRDRSKEFEP